MLSTIAGLASVAAIVAAFYFGRKSGEAKTTVKNFEEVAENVRKARKISSAVKPGTPEFERLRDQYSRK
jgi:hypothetical protein